MKRYDRGGSFRAALRVTIGGVLAMAVTAAIGRILGIAIG
jgi:VIT1/CCC1 family predicted Fe2+/Mn2+ transporter